MNLGLTGPLNPLRSGNAALGARLPRSPFAVGREAAGRGSFVEAAGPAGRGGRGGSGAPEPPAATHPSSLLPARPPAFVLSNPGQPGSGGERRRGRPELCGRARGPEPPRRHPPRGAPPASGWGRGLRPLGLKTLALRSLPLPGVPLPRAEVGILARTRCQGKRKIWARYRGSWGKNSRLSFEEVSLFLLESPSSCGCRGPCPGSAAEGN